MKKALLILIPFAIVGCSSSSDLQPVETKPSDNARLKIGQPEGGKAPASSESMAGPTQPNASN